MSERPVVSPPGAWQQPVPTVTDLPDGLRVAVHDLPGQQVASVRMVIPATLTTETRGREGSTDLMTRLLDEGCTGHSPEEFALALERRGIVLGAGAAEGGVSVDLDVPVRRLPEALDLMRLAIAEPTFPPEQVTRILRNRLAQIDHESSSAPHLAARELLRQLWAPGTRAAVPAAGTASSVSALTREEIVERHRLLGPLGATVVVAGQFGDLDVTALVEATLGGWTASGASDHSAQAPVPAGEGTRVVLVDRPGSVQSELVVAAPAPDRRDPQWPAFPVLAYLLGGSPTARIDALLREDKGWTYGMRAGMRPRARGGSFAASGSVRADVTAPALAALVDILEGARSGFSRAELTSGVDFITRATPTRWATADVVADETAALALEGLPWNFPQRLLETMSALTPEDLSAAWSRIGSDGWTIVVVGDQHSLRAPLEALDLGPLTVVSAEEVAAGVGDSDDGDDTSPKRVVEAGPVLG